jgi:hypothetical protein
MKDDYLWDKSGEPDLEVQHMERVLGQLRSKHTAQDLMPAFENLPRTKPRMFSKIMAIAAALAFAVLALGAFILLQRQSKNQVSSNLAMVNEGPTEPRIDTAVLANGTDEAKQQEAYQPAPIEVSITWPKRSAPVSRRRSVNRDSELYINEREQAEGLMAKEQLIKALEITSSKLKSVQKKVQGDRIQVPSS